MTKKSEMELWQWYCQNRREKNLFQLVFGNAIAEIEGKKNLWEWICDNGITEIWWKKNVAIGLWQWHCRNRWEITKSTHILILSVFFFTEIIWFVTFFIGKSNLRNIPYFKYIDFAHCKQNKKKKQKKHIDSYMHAVNKKNKDSINQSPQLLISSVSYSLHDSYVHRFLFSNINSFLSFYFSVCNKRQGKANALCLFVSLKYILSGSYHT